ncbi:6598_t:CDS:2 [Funneliformis mosseae]|uniref:6598_t:CDS:1 n=1 Tax=Funneliformis mosseae TaxID=27381 RepID=A0A9N9G7P2_FUNMO|nr:6598_t:CDS:2 [Funneliformis mosseae]
MNSVAKGNEYEDEIQKKLSYNVECYKIRTGSASWPQFAKVTSQVTRLGDMCIDIVCGDGGVDLMGNFKGYLLLIQCKNYSESTKVGVDLIYKLEGVMSKYPAKTLHPESN